MNILRKAEPNKSPASKSAESINCTFTEYTRLSNLFCLPPIYGIQCLPLWKSRVLRSCCFADPFPDRKPLFHAHFQLDKSLFFHNGILFIFPPFFPRRIYQLTRQISRYEGKFRKTSGRIIQFGLRFRIEYENAFK